MFPRLSFGFQSFLLRDHTKRKRGFPIVVYMFFMPMIFEDPFHELIIKLLNCRPMTIHYLPLFIPLFMGFVILEYRATRKKSPVYTFENTVLNLSCGIMERIFDLFYFVCMYLLFDWIHRNHALVDIDPGKWWNWLLAFLLLDFNYYWYHRAGHEVNLFWAAHVTHHQSEEFNFTVAFRNSFIPLIYKTMFWLPIPLLGFTPEMIIAGISVSGIWQFFLHTTVFRKLGMLEYVLVTPSAHRVHHGSNEIYLDKNYGAVLIIWDRLFRTYQKETETVRYGLTKPYQGHQPIHAWFHYWKDLIRFSARSRSVAKGAGIWFDKPGSIPESSLSARVPLRVFPQHHIRPYVFFQLAVVILALTSLLVEQEFLSTGMKALAAIWIFISALSISQIKEGIQRGWIAECIRHTVTMALILYLPPLAIVWLGLPVIGLGWLVWIRYRVK